MPYKDPTSIAAVLSGRRRTKRYHAKRKAEGNCVSCGKPRGKYAAECDCCVVRYGTRRRLVNARTKACRFHSPELYLQDRIEARKRSRIRIRQLKAEMILAYGGKCQCPGGCDITDHEFLSLDHSDGGGKKEREQFPGPMLYRHLKRLNWPKERHRLLCMNCNFAFGRYGTCPHIEREGQ